MKLYGVFLVFFMFVFLFNTPGQAADPSLESRDTAGSLRRGSAGGISETDMSELGQTFKIELNRAYVCKHWELVVDKAKQLLGDYPEQADFKDCRQAEYAVHRLAKRKRKLGDKTRVKELVCEAWLFYQAAAQRRSERLRRCFLQPANLEGYKAFLR